MRISIKLIFILFFSCIFTLSSCKKFLESKSVQTLSTPETLDDLQQILDNPSNNGGVIMNTTATDEYYMEPDIWSAIDELYSKGYVWDATLNDPDDWITQYKIILNANTTLFNLDHVTKKGQEIKSDQIRGASLFLRAHAFFQITQLYAQQYDSSTSDAIPGIPLRLNADFNQASTRSTLQQTYDQIINDLQQAANLLPDNSFKTRPSKPACLGLLARAYLQVGNYTKALEYSSLYLQVKNELLNYNSLDGNLQYPMGNYRDNPEVVYYYYSGGFIGYESLAKIDTTLYNSFEANDLRKNLFFVDNGDGSFSFRGKYTGAFELFTGIATDEIYLIRSECYARLGNEAAALNDLNQLLSKRYDPSFTLYKPTSPNTTLKIILNERKKQLIARGLRWSDLKRLNKDPKFSISIKRKLESQEYLLAPNDPRYTLLIPIEIMNRSTLQQNPR
jgi:hypothetical protein